jgi:uncharacterized protein (TIGR02001 family)
MKTYLTLSAIALAAAATLSSGTVLAQAAAPAPEFTLTGNFGAVSDYRFRGLQQNDGSGAIQGGFDVAHKSGFYLGTWASNVDDWASGANSQGLEVDLYGGYTTEISGVGVNVGLIAYKYPGNSAYTSDTEEAFVGFTYGPAVFKTSYTLGKNYFASTSSGQDASGTIYYDLTLSQEVAPKLVASIHAGYTDYKLDTAASKVSYADYNVGLTYDLNGFILGAKYFWNDVSSGTKSYASSAGSDTGTKLYKDGFAVSVLKAF